MVQESIEAQVVALCLCTRNGARITRVTVTAAFHKHICEEQQDTDMEDQFFQNSKCTPSRKQPAQHDFISWLITAILNEDTLYDDYTV